MMNTFCRLKIFFASSISLSFDSNASNRRFYQHNGRERTHET